MAISQYVATSGVSIIKALNRFAIDLVSWWKPELLTIMIAIRFWNSIVSGKLIEASITIDLRHTALSRRLCRTPDVSDLSKRHQEGVGPNSEPKYCCFEISNDTLPLNFYNTSWYRGGSGYGFVDGAGENACRSQF